MPVAKADEGEVADGRLSGLELDLRARELWSAVRPRCREGERRTTRRTTARWDASKERGRRGQPAGCEERTTSTPEGEARERGRTALDALLVHDPAAALAAADGLARLDLVRGSAVCVCASGRAGSSEGGRRGGVGQLELEMKTTRRAGRTGTRVLDCDGRWRACAERLALTVHRCAEGEGEREARTGPAWPRRRSRSAPWLSPTCSECCLL